MNEIEKIIEEFKPNIIIKEVPQSFISPGQVMSDEYIFGSQQTFTGLVIRPDGQWPIPTDEELQAKQFETDACISFGLIHSVVSIMKQLFGLDVNYSERFLAKGSGTDPVKGGNTPQAVAEWARKNGFVDEEILPFDDTLKDVSEYYAPLKKDAIQKGKEWLKEWAFKHDWLSDGALIPPETIKRGLTYSPLGCAVYAWAYDADKDLYVRPEKAKDIHWVELLRYKENEYWIVRDSYKPFIKKLEWDYPFYFAKRYYIQKAEKRTFWQLVINYIKELFK